MSTDAPRFGADIQASAPAAAADLDAGTPRPFVEVEGLEKRFGDLAAVRGLSFTVRKGEILGFLGPNGAGKSTSMKAITGFLTPSAGTVRVLGHDVTRERTVAQALIGYLPEGAPAYPDMTPRQFLGFIANVRGFTGDRKERAIQTAVARTQLAGVLDQPIETLSKGFKRRVGLAQAILHDPPVLIMDEPTDGLDPNQKFAVRRLIAGMGKDKAIVISTHILEEVEAVCTRAMIIDRGRIVADGTPRALTARSRYHNAVTVELPRGEEIAPKAALAALPEVGAVTERALEPDGIRLTAFPAAGAPIVDAVAGLAKRDAWPVRGLYAEAGRLDEVFRELTSSDAGGSAQEASFTPLPAEPDTGPAAEPAIWKEVASEAEPTADGGERPEERRSKR